MRIEMEMSTREAQSLCRLLPLLSASRDRVAGRARAEYDRTGEERYAYLWRTAEEDARTLDKVMDAVFDGIERGVHE